MTRAWLFPGQGTDLGELPRGVLEAPGPVRKNLEHASEVVGLDLRAALRDGDPRMWKTELAQPALVAVTLGLAEARETAGERVDAVAGHSLGELAAVAFAGCLTAEDAITTAAARGRLMAEAARHAPGGMAAVRCADVDVLSALVEHGRRFGALSVAAHNAPTQWVVSGARQALGAMMTRTAATMLPVAGPWHTPAMASAAAAWAPLLRGLAWSPARRPLVLAGSATFARVDTDVPGALLRQLTEPVLWMETLEALLAAGVSQFVSLGPGHALKGLVREVLEARGPAAPSAEVQVA